MSAKWGASAVRNLGAAPGIKTAAMLFLAPNGSSCSQHLVRSTIRRYHIARSLAELLAEDHVSRLGLYNTTLASNLVEGLIPYLLLLMHFFETYRTRIANFIIDPGNADYFTGNSARRPMQLPIIEMDILTSLYSQENISHLYTVYTWLLKLLADERFNNSYINAQQRFFLWCGFEPVRNAIRISDVGARKTYVEDQLEQVRQVRQPTGLEAAGIPSAILPTLDTGTLRTLASISIYPPGFPRAENRKRLGFPIDQNGDIRRQSRREEFLALLESRNWVEQNLLVRRHGREM